MHLRSLKAQRVCIRAAGFECELRKDETIWTESCHKFHAERDPRDGGRGGLRMPRAMAGRHLALCREPVDRVSAVVEFRAVSFRIGAREILKSLTLSVEAGETLVLLGRSGSGKTTALKMVNGLLFPSAGEVLVDGIADHAHGIRYG